MHESTCCEFQGLQRASGQREILMAEQCLMTKIYYAALRHGIIVWQIFRPNYIFTCYHFYGSTLTTIDYNDSSLQGTVPIWWMMEIKLLKFKVAETWSNWSHRPPRVRLLGKFTKTAFDVHRYRTHDYLLLRFQTQGWSLTHWRSRHSRFNYIRRIENRRVLT